MAFVAQLSGRVPVLPKSMPGQQRCRPIGKRRPCFFEKETAFILLGQPQSMGSQTTIQKFENLDMARYLPVMGRNLRALHKLLMA